MQSNEDEAQQLHQTLDSATILNLKQENTLCSSSCSLWSFVAHFHPCPEVSSSVFSWIL